MNEINSHFFFFFFTSQLAFRNTCTGNIYLTIAPYTILYSSALRYAPFCPQISLPDDTCNALHSNLAYTHPLANTNTDQYYSNPYTILYSCRLFSILCILLNIHEPACTYLYSVLYNAYFNLLAVLYTIICTLQM